MNWIIALFLTAAIGAFCLLAFCIVVYVKWCEVEDGERQQREREYEGLY